MARLSLLIDVVVVETESSHSSSVCITFVSFPFESGDASLVMGSPNATSKIFLAISPTSSLVIEDCSEAISPTDSLDTLVILSEKLPSSEAAMDSP